jgi:hypothetical protein
VKLNALALLALIAACGGNVTAGDDHADDDGVAIDAGPDGPPVDAWVPTVPPEVDGRLVINEFMASNAITAQDETGQAGDWIEIYNPNDQSLSLHGYTVTDVLSNAAVHRLNGVIIPAHGHLVLWADERPTAGALHLDFKLASDGGEIGLARPDGSYIDRVRYGAQETDFSAARSPDGSDAWTIVWIPTPAAANANGAGHPVGLEQTSAPPEMVPAAGDLTEHFLGYDRMPELAITVSPEGVASLEQEPRVTVPATLVFEGRAYGPVGIRLKGSNSFLPFSQKPSLRVNVDEYNDKARFWGLKDLTLNNMSGDFSMMHERLSYWVARMAGVPASRCNHLRLTVNGQFYGLYANVETVKKQFLARWFADNTGSLFEATDVDFAPQYVSHFELESGADDRSLLEGAANALAMANADEAIAAAGNYIDMSRFLRFWAMTSVVGQFDSFPYSQPGDDFYVYADPATHKLAFMPWGMDETFMAGDFDVTQIFSVLARRCKESPACFAAYKEQTMAIQSLTENMGLATERQRVVTQIAPYTVMDTRKPYTDDQVTQFQGSLRWFISDRRAHLSGWLYPPPPTTP